MNTRFLSTFVAMALTLTACSPKNADETAQLNSDVDLASSADASLAGMEMPLEASFMSDHQTFAYTFYYDGADLALMDGPLSETVSMGPNFKVQEGGILVGSTSWAADLSSVAEKAGDAVQVGDYAVYRYEDFAGDCMEDHAVLPFAQEALRLVLTSCPGEDRAAGQAALDSLLEHAELVELQ